MVALSSHINNEETFYVLIENNLQNTLGKTTTKKMPMIISKTYKIQSSMSTLLPLV